MILHIISSDGMFTKDFYQFISEKYSDQEHVFLSGIPAHPNFKSSAQNPPKIVVGRSITGLRTASKSDAIVVHGLVSFNVLLFLFFQPWLHKKCNWLIFGGDIYGVQRKQGFAARIKMQFVEVVRKMLYPRFGHITVVSIADYEYARKHYGVEAPCFKVTYPVAATARIDQLEADLQSPDSTSTLPTRIQVGNSATDTNHHIDALNMIAHFKNQDVEVFLPLNYGNGDFTKYADQVEQHARSIFGSRVIALREQVDGQEYLDLLARVDIGIFNNDRQQATGNIGQLTLTGSKIYMRPSVSMWEHFKSLGCEFYDIKEVSEVSFSDFSHYDRDVQLENARIIRNRHHITTKIEQWDAVFLGLSRDLGFSLHKVGGPDVA